MKLFALLCKIIFANLAAEGVSLEMRPEQHRDMTCCEDARIAESLCSLART